MAAIKTMAAHPRRPNRKSPWNRPISTAPVRFFNDLSYLKLLLDEILWLEHRLP